jgi:cysteine desulfurase
MTNKRIYLDHNATTGVKYAVRVAMSEVMADPYNASSVHSFGREAKKKLDEARESILEMAGAEGQTVIFTSSGTEANNLALRGFKKCDSMIVSAVEHTSVLKAVCMSSGGMVPVDENGLVSLDVLKVILGNSKGRSLVSIILANNETGVIQPIKEICDLVVGTGGYVHCDASQAFGKIPVNFNKLNVDMMTVSAHKFGGPQGIGALIVKKGLEINPIIVGGGQEGRMRAGTENVSAIVGFGAASQLVSKMPSDLRDYLETEISAFAPEAKILGAGVDRLPNTTCVAIPNMGSDAQLIAFDLAGIAVSNGSACSSGTVTESHVLKAMNVERKFVNNAVRVSLGADTLKEEIDAFLEVWKHNYQNATTEEEAA